MFRCRMGISGCFMVIVALCPLVWGGVMDLINWNETPVGGAHIKMTEFAFMERPDWEKANADEIAAYIQQRSANGSPTTDNWFESAELFRAAYVLAKRLPVSSEDRRRWLDVALAAAQRSIKQDSETVYLGFDCVLDMEPADEYLCARLLKLFEDELVVASRPAIPLFNIYCLHRAAGNADCATIALERAYQLCPKDPLVGAQVIRSRTDAGQVPQAMQAVLAQDFAGAVNDPTVKLALLADKEEKIAELDLLGGDRVKAQEHYQNAWSSLEEIAQLQRAGQIVIPPAVCLQRNRCATSLGLLWFEKGNIGQATAWLKSSSTDGEFLRMMGYDLRLAEKLAGEPSAKEEVIRYLEVARACGPEHAKTRADKLLQDLKATDFN